MSGIDTDQADQDSRDRPCFSLAALLADLRRHPELDLETLIYHLAQSDATAAEGYWHAAVNEARSFLEALLVTVLHAVRPDAPDKSNDIGTTNGTPFRCYRRSLFEAGFLGVDENELLHYVYGVASAKGSHHGVTTESWSRLARRMIFATGEYVIKRYQAWKAATAGVSDTAGQSATAAVSPDLPQWGDSTGARLMRHRVKDP